MIDRRQYVTGLKSALFGVAVAAATSTGALAAGVTFTWNPAVPIPGQTLVGPANDIVVADFANIPINSATGNLTENGILTGQSFLLNGNQVPNSNFTLPGGWSLVFGFTASGNLSGIPANGSGLSTNGTFSSLSYTMYAIPGATPAVTFSTNVSDPVVSLAGAVPVAFGHLIDGTVTLTAPAGGGFSPTANLDLTLNACTAAGQGNTGFGQALCGPADESGFFVTPLAQDISLLIGNFSATTSVSSITPIAGGNDLQIVGGGGNLTIATPEPASIAVMGVGLIGLARIVRRRRKA
jgi:hypothetical protein